MARRPSRLSVWCYGVRVAELTPTRRWELICRYTADALDRWPGNAPVLSCSLPLSPRPQDASVFCAGLLPEGQHRLALAARAGIAANDVHGMLERYGRDVAGAIVIATDEPPARQPSVVPYTAAELAREVEQLHEHPLAVYGDSELSIAGLQDKMLLVDLGAGRWGRPVHGQPSTHMLKLDDRQRPGLVSAEATCLSLAAELGLTNAAPRLTEIAGISCLIVERFDRRVHADGTVERIHQEDVCQALARDPEVNNGRGKYQSAGGPSLAETADLLDRYGADAAVELTKLVKAVTFTVLIGNADAHGRNLALLHPDATEVTVASLYDTVPTVLWPALRTNVAMSVNDRWQLADVTLDDIVDEATRWSLSREVARAAALHTAEQLLTALRSRSEVADSTLGVTIAARSEALLATS